MKFFAYLICYCIYPFSFLFPRRKKKWAFGSFRGAFNDNAKYLFIHASEHMPEITSAWISINKDTVREIRAKGLRAYHVFSLKGIGYALTSKYWFFNAYSSDIMFCLSGGAKQVNLWHGLPLKRIEFDIDSGLLADRYVKKTLKERYYHPEVFRRPDYMVTSTDLFSEVFARSFRVSPDRCLGFGLARNGILTWSEEKRMAFIKRYEPTATMDLIAELKRYEKVFIYMPTWRDSQSDFIAVGFDFGALDSALADNNALFIIKPHANTTVDSDAIAGLNHIKLLPTTMDVYPILPYSDVLVTDYSSIMYDYILMEKKDVILYLFDYQEYINERPFIWPFDEMSYGHRAYDFATLLNLVCDHALCPDEDAKAVLADKCWGNYGNNASERIALFFQQC